MGATYKRGKVWWIKYYSHGKPICESSKSKKEADARHLLKKREGEIADGRMPGVYFDRVTFDELAEDYLREFRLNQRKSIATAEITVKQLKTYFAGFRVPNITTPRVQEYAEKRLEEGKANTTINRELAILQAILNVGARQTPPKVDRVPYIPKLKNGPPRRGFFEHGEFLALRDALPERLKGLVTFAYRTGWRSAEIRGLTWDHVDLQNNLVWLEAGEAKNEDPRMIYLDEELQGVLRQQWEARKRASRLSPYVFPGRLGGKLKQFYRSWEKACEKAGLHGKLFHDFRRTAVRNMVRSGVIESVAMKVSGHRTRRVFERYNIVNEADLKMAAQKQEAYLKSQMVTKTVTISKLPSAKSNGA